jgi:hypothetical protein
VYVVKRKSYVGPTYRCKFFAAKVTRRCWRNVELEVFHRTVGHPYLVQLVSFFETKVCSSSLNVSVFRQILITEIYCDYQHTAMLLQVYICESWYWALVVTTLLVVH